MSTTIDPGLVTDLAGQVSGTVLAPHDAGYDAARAVHNGLIDRRPALIVRCRTPGDVVAALALARREGLEVSVRGGGHNVAGRAVTDGGLMIDLAEMKAITIDPERATATAQGGVTWGELNAAAHEHGLAVTGGAVSTTGVAGLTLGGGLGWLMAKHGLAADNLLAVELVTADGDVLDVDAASHPDLFWALRGGGGNFGVATSFTYRLHPVETVVGGLIAHPIDAAPDLLRFYRDAVAERLGRPHRLRRRSSTHRRVGREARRPRRLPHGRRRRGRARARAVQDVGLSAGGRRRRDALPGDEHAPRRWLPGRSPATTGCRASPAGSRTS